MKVKILSKSRIIVDNIGKMSIIMGIMRFIIMMVVLMVGGKAYAEPIKLPVIAQIESSGNPGAIGDHGQALGLYQLHYGVIKDYNKHHDTHYSHRMALNRHYADLVADWYLNQEIPRLIRHYRLNDSLENRIIAYNFGIGNLVKGKPLPAVTKAYIAKYRRLENADL